MFRFILKGIIRDRSRSLFPIIVVTTGVMLTVVMQSWIRGVMGDMVDFNARFLTGHVKIMTRSYAESQDQMPNDLAMIGVDELIKNLRRDFPDVDWVKRIRFGGLIDVPDENGVTISQGPALGLAVDLLSKSSSEIERLNIKDGMKRGRMPRDRGEALLSDQFATRLDVKPGDVVTLITSTMYGSMAMKNFIVSGTVEFGIRVMDMGAVIVDIKDAQQVLDMEDGSSEILGYFKGGVYDEHKAKGLMERFNAKYSNTDDEFSPIMLRLRDQNDLASLLDYVSDFSKIMIAVFVVAMSIVLWNAGLIGGLRRYGEIGLRLAMGESKGGVHRSMIMESVAIGVMGSLFGTIIGLIIAWILQTRGIDISSMMRNATMMLPSTFRARITPGAYFIGFVPGLFSTVLGTVLAGIGIYKRETAGLFRELEA